MNLTIPSIVFSLTLIALTEGKGLVNSVGFSGNVNPHLTGGKNLDSDSTVTIIIIAVVVVVVVITAVVVYTCWVKRRIKKGNEIDRI